MARRRTDKGDPGKRARDGAGEQPGEPIFVRVDKELKELVRRNTE